LGDIARINPISRRSAATNRLVAVVLLFEIMLVAAVVVISWFALYTLYRLITDES
jgi:hypothetical protein